MKPTPSNRLLAHTFHSLLATSITLTVQATTFDVPAGTTQKLSTVLDVGEGLTKTGDGTLAVTIDQFVNDDVVLNAGTLIFYGAADPEETSPSFVINGGLLMLGGDAFSTPVLLNGGTLRIGAQRSIPWTSITDGRRLIATQGGTSDFNFAGSATFYTAGRATNQAQTQDIIDLGIPETGFITSLSDPSRAYEFRIANTGVNASRVNSHGGAANGPNTKYINIPAEHQLKYAEVQTLLGTSAGTSMQFAGYARYTDAPTSGVSTGTSTGIPLYTAAASNPVLTVGTYATGTQTYSTAPLSLYDHAFSVNPEKTLTAFGLLRSGNNSNAGGYFALSGLAVNEASFTSNISVTADSVLDLAGAPIATSSATLGAGTLDLNNSTLTTTRSINNTTGYRATFTGGTLTGMGVIDVANSTGNGAGTVIVNGPLAGSGSLVKTGPGALGLPGTNTYEGVTEIDAGTVFLNNVSGLGTTAAGTTLFGGTLYLLNGSHTAPVTEPITVAGTATLRSGNDFSYTLSGTLALDANLTVTLDAGTTITHSGVISGPATLVKNSSETLVLSGDNSFGSGALVLGSGTNNRGYIRLESNTALGNHDSVTLAGNQGGISGLQLEGGVTIAKNLSSEGRQNATTTGYILRSISGNNAWNGNVTITSGGGSYGFVSDSGTLTLGGTITSSYTSTLGARLVSFAGAGNITVTGNLLNGGNDSPSKNLAVSKDGSGTLMLAGTNDYSGNTTFNNGTTLLTGSISQSAIVTIGASAILDVSSHAAPGYAFTATQTLRGNGTLIGNATTTGTIAPVHYAGTLTTNGNLAFGIASTLSSEIDILGTAQVETATAAGAAIADGEVTVTVTSAALGVPVTLNVPILIGETSDAWAVKVRAALAADPFITPLFSVGGINSAITLTRLSGLANDTSLNIALANGAISPGITAAATSANTTAGVAPGTALLAVTGGLDVSGATLNLLVSGTPTAPAYVIATYGSLAPGNFAAVNNLPEGYEIDYAYASGTAIAVVQGGPVAGDYASWASANGVTGGTTGDSDNDGILNLLEYALALNFNGADGSAGTFTGNLLTFTKRQDAIDNGDVLWIIETSGTLAADSWTPAVTQNPGNPDSTISYTLPAGQGKIFGRLKVVEN
jgi:autotransporter-associated beta strand protein